MIKMKNTLRAYVRLMRIDKPIGTLLLLWPTLWALWLTDPRLNLVIIFVLGVFIMRAAGCVINDYADRQYDGHVERTKSRPLANGQLSVRQAFTAFFILIFIAMLLLLMLNPLSWLIAGFALLTTLAYPFMKRFTHLPQLVLSIAFSWGIPMVYAATIGQFPLTCWLLCLANIFWTVAYDTQYAMVDRNDDVKIGVKSTAILFGHYDKMIIATLQFFAAIILLIIGYVNQLPAPFYFCWLVACSLFVYQYYLIKDRQREQCFHAFLNNNYVGLILFIGILLSLYPYYPSFHW